MFDPAVATPAPPVAPGPVAQSSLAQVAAGLLGLDPLVLFSFQKRQAVELAFIWAARISVIVAVCTHADQHPRLRINDPYIKITGRVNAFQLFDLRARAAFGAPFQ